MNPAQLYEMYQKSLIDAGLDREGDWERLKPRERIAWKCFLMRLDKYGPIFVED